MPTYKLTYFKGRGRAEVARMLFTLGGQQFEDIRLSREDWLEFKPKTPMGQLPLLEVDDVMICQSNAIARYIAKKFGYAGKTELDQARVDMIIDCLGDMGQPLIKIFTAKTEEEKTAVKTKFQEETAPEYLAKLENILKQKKGGDGWFVGDDITWADVEFICMVDFLKTMGGIDVHMEKYPKLNAVKTKAESHPKIQEWCSKRPE